MNKATLAYLLRIAQAELDHRREEYRQAMTDADMTHDTKVMAETRLSEAARAVEEVREEAGE